MSSAQDSIIDMGRISAEDVHLNISPVVIATTEDKLRLALYQRHTIFRARDAWIAPLGLLISIVLALATSTFRKFGLEAAVWEAIFWLGGIASFLWLGWALYKRPTDQSFDEFVQVLKRAR
jgi:hypothetical protein